MGFRKIAFVILMLIGVNAFAEQAAPCTLQNIHGESIPISNYTGKIVVLDFWASWCVACREAFPMLNHLQQKYGDSGVVVVGINLEKISLKKIVSFIKKAGIQYDVLLDPKMVTTRLYNVKGVPSLAIINREQRVVRFFRGLDKTTVREIDELLNQMTSGQLTTNKKE